MRVLSLGAGVQSSALLLMAHEGEIDIDYAIFADTGWEGAATYAWLEWLKQNCSIPIYLVTAGNIYKDTLDARAETRIASPPLHLRTKQGHGMLRRQCTNEYKIRPIRALVRTMGATKKNPFMLLLGISWDEIGRMKTSDVQYLVYEYPLINRRLRRTDCLAWMQAHGYPEPPKSACVGCPYKDDRRWRELKRERPNEFEQAVQFDESIRQLPRIDGEAYLHRKLMPLRQIDFSTAEERGQQVFDAEGFQGSCEGGFCGV